MAAENHVELFPVIGNLRDHFLPELLFQLYEGKRTGTLVFMAGETKKALVYEQGEIVYASSNMKEDTLGESLVRSGMISLTDFAQAEKMMVENSQLRFGEALMNISAINDGGLMQGLVYQMHGIIYSLFLWPTAQFRFANEKMPPHKISRLPLSTLDAILRGTTLIRSWVQLREKLSSLDIKLSPVPDFQHRLALLKLYDYEHRILESIQPEMPVSDICVLSPVNEFETCRFLIASLMIHLLVKCPRQN
jgi:hypothetical protein